MTDAPQSDPPQSDSPRPDSAQPGYSPSQPPPSDYPQPAYGQPVAVDPGKTLGIVGFILAFFVSIAGLVVSIIALRASKKAGFKNGLALAGIIVSALAMVATIIAFVVFAFAAKTVIQQECAQLGPGTHTLSNGTTFTCP